MVGLACSAKRHLCTFVASCAIKFSFSFLPSPLYPSHDHRRPPLAPLPLRPAHARRSAGARPRNAQPMRRRRALSPVHRLRGLRLRRRAAENRRLFARCRFRPARRLGRDDRIRPCQRHLRRRYPPRRGDAEAARSRQGTGRRPAPAKQPPPLHRRLAARRGGVRREGQAARSHRQGRPRPRSAGFAGQRQHFGQLVGGRDRPRRWLRRAGCAALGPAQRQHRRRTERAARDRQFRHGRALALRRSVQARKLESRDRRGLGAGA